MDSKNTDLHLAFATLQEQISSAHREWTAKLAAHIPEFADRLWQLNEVYCDRHARLEALLLLFVSDPSLNIEGMLREYNSLLNSEPFTASAVPPRPEFARDLGPRQRAGETKRQRTRQRLITAATQLVKQGETTHLLEKAAEAAGVGTATAYLHFKTRDELIRLIYRQLLDPVLALAFGD